MDFIQILTGNVRMRKNLAGLQTALMTARGHALKSGLKATLHSTAIPNTPNSITPMLNSSGVKILHMEKFSAEQSFAMVTTCLVLSPLR